MFICLTLHVTYYWSIELFPVCLPLFVKPRLTHIFKNVSGKSSVRSLAQASFRVGKIQDMGLLTFSNSFIKLQVEPIMGMIVCEHIELGLGTGSRFSVLCVLMML